MLIVHAADIHLDSPLVGLEKYEGCPVDVLRGATRKAFEGLVTTALEERADLVLLAGDLYDGAWKDYATGFFFVKQMVRLQSGGIPVVIVRGNHDAESEIARKLKLPDNVHDLSTASPESFEIEQ
ncbi:MAG: DNA repair exonuclease, partial [Polyangiaceae bacterium]|nr:DNA repair exonuclease [Polyangiaceae bacterium]